MPRTPLTSVGHAYTAIYSDFAGYAYSAPSVPDEDWMISESDMYSMQPGNVGIGTASPAAKLDVVGNRIRLSDSTVNRGKEILLRVDGAEADLDVNGANLFIKSNTGNTVIQGFGGNVGIGLTTPTEQLQVGGVIHSTTGGFKFPDGTVQTSASTGGGTGWSLTGNAGTDTSTNFLGTTDNMAVHIRSNNTTLFRVDPNYNVIGGHGYVSSGVVGAAISGGGNPIVLSYVTDDYGTIGGGHANQAGDGVGSTADAAAATVAGGSGNLASAEYATVGGGYANGAYDSSATVAGGYWNSASDPYTTVGGGSYNDAQGIYSTVSGGYNNYASDSAATIGGGYDHTASGIYSTIAGGWSCTASKQYTTVGGGSGNRATGEMATIGGGSGNDATGWYAVVAGGSVNEADSFSAVCGGSQNDALGFASFIGGGTFNSASGSYSGVAGGYADTSAGLYSFSQGFNAKVPSGHSESVALNGQVTTASGQTRIGIISKASGTFSIDHPLDPDGKILNHYFVESPQMMLVYRGAAELDSDGRAEVLLPDYFDALNENTMVQLTGVGTFEVFVAEDVRDNRFVIGGRPGTKVYWTVTGERSDPSAEITRTLMPVEQVKDAELAGRSLDDDLLVATMDQLREMGEASRFGFRTAAGREKYEKMRSLSGK
jgi:hypothetical protein